MPLPSLSPLPLTCPWASELRERDSLYVHKSGELDERGKSLSRQVSHRSMNVL